MATVNELTDAQQRQMIQAHLVLLKAHLSGHVQMIHAGMPIAELFPKIQADIEHYQREMYEVMFGPECPDVTDEDVPHSLVTDTYVKENGILFPARPIGAHAQYVEEIVPDGEPF